MGRPKAGLRYRGEDQAHYLVALLATVCEGAWLSVGADPDAGAGFEDLPVLRDRDANLGPAAGLLAAWDRMPRAAWLVAAVDMPFLDRPAVERLAGARDPARAATAALNPESLLPEPLFAVYEPAFRPHLEEAAAAGGPGLAGVLARLRNRGEGPGVALVPFEDARALRDVDTREEYRILMGGVA
jgi:molybdopterin-guanine dinucleotide biosynthesis protein A